MAKKSGMISNDATQQFIRRHRQDDVHQLALQAHGDDGVDLQLALEQIAGWQSARRKLPSWADIDGLWFPPQLSMEQCSSEPAARYKEAIIKRLTSQTTTGATSSFVDLTGGFGVDFSFLSQCFTKAVYVERQEKLCEVARHNFPLLGLCNAEVVCADAEAYLRSMPPTTIIYIDPARRDACGKRTFAISDCTPDVVALRHLLTEKAEWVLVKLSPMLDWHKAVDDLQPYVREVHIVAVGGECKELLLVLSLRHDVALTLHCVNDDTHFTCAPNQTTSHTFIPHPSSIIHHPSPLIPPASVFFVFEPNAAIMKAGCFVQLSAAFGITPLAPNSHLFVSNSPIPSFPGRQFRVVDITSLNKKDLRRTLSGVTKANVAVRNFPLSANDLRRRLKLADGGNIYIFGTTLADNSHVLLMCEKV